MGFGGAQGVVFAFDDRGDFLAEGQVTPEILDDLRNKIYRGRGVRGGEIMTESFSFALSA